MTTNNEKAIAYLMDVGWNPSWDLTNEEFETMFAAALHATKEDE